MQAAHVRNTCSLHAHKQCMLCTQVAHMLRIYEVWWNLAHVLHLVHMAHVQHSLHHRCSTCAAHIHFCKGMIHKNYISVAGSYCNKPNSFDYPRIDPKASSCSLGLSDIRRQYTLTLKPSTSAGLSSHW